MYKAMMMLYDLDLTDCDEQQQHGLPQQGLLHKRLSEARLLKRMSEAVAQEEAAHEAAQPDTVAVAVS
jgi:inhibitor of KinA sporulation pathway (predicted exonuclease)